MLSIAPADAYRMQVIKFAQLAPEFRVEQLRDLPREERKRVIMMLGLSPQQKASTTRGTSEKEGEELLTLMAPWDREATERAIAFAQALDQLGPKETTTTTQLIPLPTSNVAACLNGTSLKDRSETIAALGPTDRKRALGGMTDTTEKATEGGKSDRRPSSLRGGADVTGTPETPAPGAGEATKDDIN
jgi:hypothetical protein